MKTLTYYKPSSEVLLSDNAGYLPATTYHTGNQLVDPYVLFKKVQLQEGMHVADFGAGRTGHIVFPAAQIVGERGIVYAVDILKNVLESITKRAELEGFLNIHTVWADIEREGSVLIPQRSLDLIFMINVLFHCSDLAGVLKEAFSLLKEKSRIVIVDWIKKLANLGPADGGMVDFSLIKQAAVRDGFTVQEDFYLNQYHRGLILFKA